MVRPDKLSAGSDLRETSRQPGRGGDPRSRSDRADRHRTGDRGQPRHGDRDHRRVDPGRAGRGGRRPDAAPATPGAGVPGWRCGCAAPAHILAGIKVSSATISTVLIDFDGTTLVRARDRRCPRRGCRRKRSSRQIVDTLARGRGRDRTRDRRPLRPRRRDLGGGRRAGGAGPLVAVARPAQRRAARSCSRRPCRCRCFSTTTPTSVAKAEQLFGEGRGVRDFLVVTIEHGVGMGIVIDGQIYRGTRGLRCRVRPHQGASRRRALPLRPARLPRGLRCRLRAAARGRGHAAGSRAASTPEERLDALFARPRGRRPDRPVDPRTGPAGCSRWGSPTSSTSSIPS